MGLVKKIETQAVKFSDKFALKLGDKTMTYQQLNVKVNQLSQIILKENGFSKETETVALLFKHGAEMIIGLLGTLKTGKTYIPLDIDFPEDRLQYILENSAAKLLITDSSNVKQALQLTNGNIQIINIDEISESISSENPVLDIDPMQAAVILYTSGSTGRPKGVIQSHRNIEHFIGEYSNLLQINSLDKVALFTSYSHAVSIIDIFSALLNGACILPYNLKAKGSMEEMPQWLKDEAVTIYHTVPTVFRYCMDLLKNEERLSQIRLLILGGEAVSQNDVEKYNRHFSDNCKFVNLFGSSEVLIATSYVIDKGTKVTSPIVPVGYLIDGVEAYVLNENEMEVPIFATGEIAYRSEFLAQGYWNMPEKTSEVFVKDPITGEGLVYKSGDLGRIMPDECLEYMGRKDFQVKIRGYRVEPEEIETVLDQVTGIRKSIVVPFKNKNDEYYLAAYCVTEANQNLENERIRDILTQRLPDYMIPAYVTQLNTLPLTTNGKIDRKALPEPEADHNIDIVYVSPQSKTEVKLIKIWQETLGIDKIGINDNFFNLGGHSLKASSLILKIHKEFNVELSLREVFNTPTVKELAKLIKEIEQNSYSSIKIVEKMEYYPVSAAQKRMYIINQLNDGITSYNNPEAIMIEGMLDKNHLAEAFRILIKRHEGFRTSFEMVEGELRQKVHQDVDLEITHFKSETNQVTEVIKEFIKPFDLSKTPLLRIGLIEQSQNKHILLLDMHHIITDGTSMGIIIQELASIYKGQELPPLKIQYKDFAVWQNEVFRSGVIQKQEEYWLQVFSNEIPVLNMPTDFPRPSLQSFDGEKIDFEADEAIVRGLAAVTTNTGATQYMVLLATFNILLSKYSSQEDIVIGSPIAGRRHADLGNIVGMFVNTLALRNFPNENKTFEEFLAEVKESSLQAYENQDYQFEELVEKLGVKRDLSRNPLFDVVFVLQNMNMATIDFAELIFKPYEFNNQVSKFDLTLTAVETETNIRFRLEYSTKLFQKETIERLSLHFKNILREIAADPQVKLSDIEIMTEAEKHRILVEFNDTQADYPKDKTIHQLFEEQVARTPANIAVVFEEKQLTYQELNKKSNSLARMLREKGMNKDTIIGIMVERSLEMFIGIMAILKAGGAYLPIDPEYPTERIKFMLEDSGVKLLLTQGSLPEKIHFDGISFLLEDQDLYHYENSNLSNNNQSGDLAYIIYTSGSTGQPKGVMIRQYSLVNLCYWHNYNYQVTARDRSTKYAGFGFDASVWEIFPYLVVGATIFVIPKRIQLTIEELNAFYETNRISISFLPTQICEQFIRFENKTLRKLLTGGDKLNSYIAKNYDIVNNYGPTENTVVSTSFKIDKTYVNIPIGKPISNFQVYIVDRNNRIVPVGVPGELCIAGAGLAKGYLNRPELTLEKFIDCPFWSGEKMYKTGDLVRWLPDGNIEFLGRLDHQVKIRGFRIELGEIENRLLKHKLVKEAVVVDKDGPDGLRYLSAYLVADQELTTSDLKNYLAQELPDYMIPTHFVKLETIPMTSNGKIDRRTLGQLEDSLNLLNTGVEYVAPGTDFEKIIIEVWQEVLKNDHIGVNDNFFDIGGNSMALIQVHRFINQRLQTEMAQEISIVTLFQNPTVRSLIQYLNRDQENSTDKKEIENMNKAKTVLQRALSRNKGAGNE